LGADIQNKANRLCERQMYQQKAEKISFKPT
jgi:hypothetical protein